MNVYRVDGKSGAVTVVADGINAPNGLAFTPDEKKLYIVESRSEPRRILVYDVAASGDKIANGKVLIDAGPHGTPDGLRIDIDGNLWCGWGMTAELDGVRVFTAAGRADRPYRAARALRQSLFRRRASATACSWRRRIRSIRFTSTPKEWPAADRQRRKHLWLNVTRVGPRMSKAVVHGNTVYLAGIVADSPKGKSMTEQTKNILAQIDGFLAKAGTDKSKLLVGQYLDHRHGQFRRDERGVGRLGGARQRAGASDG